jgi:hypothetical protein
MQPDREADRLSASIVEVKYEWSCTSVCSLHFCHGMHRYDLSFTFFKLPIIQVIQKERSMFLEVIVSVSVI